MPTASVISIFNGLVQSFTKHGATHTNTAFAVARVDGGSDGGGGDGGGALLVAFHAAVYAALKPALYAALEPALYAALEPALEAALEPALRPALRLGLGLTRALRDAGRGQDRRAARRGGGRGWRAALRARGRQPCLRRPHAECIQSPFLLRDGIPRPRHAWREVQRPSLLRRGGRQAPRRRRRRREACYLGKRGTHLGDREATGAVLLSLLAVPRIYPKSPLLLLAVAARVGAYPKPRLSLL